MIHVKISRFIEDRIKIPCRRRNLLVAALCMSVFGHVVSEYPEGLPIVGSDSSVIGRVERPRVSFGDVAPKPEDNSIAIRDLCDGSYVTLQPIVYDIGDDAYPCAQIVVPVGFVTDFGSIPRPFRNVIEGIGTPRDLIYLLHDWVYVTEYFAWQGVAYRDDLSDASANRSMCDDLLLMGCKMAGDNWLTRNTIWSAVRVFGGSVWKKHTKESIAAARILLTSRKGVAA